MTHRSRACDGLPGTDGEVGSDGRRPGARDNQAERDQWSRHEERVRESDERLRRTRTRIEENSARIRELIASVTEMQADIARLDAAS